MEIVTWNVNSIKVRLPIVIQYLSRFKPDVLVLQEIKCIDENFPGDVFDELGYHSVCCGQKTYNGVAILSKLKPSIVKINPVNTEENEKRSLLATINGINILNLYVVNGQNVGTDKYKYKLKWLKALVNLIKKEKLDESKTVILGDFNIAPTDNDVFDPVSCTGEILCSKKERDVLAELCDMGFTDTFITSDYPPKTFTWWDYRGGAFHRNIGYRIDLVYASNKLANKCEGLIIDKETRHKSWCADEPRTSDHVPVRAIFKI